MTDRDETDKLARALEIKKCELVLNSLGKYFREESLEKCDEWLTESADIKIPADLDLKLRKITEEYEKIERAAGKKARRKKCFRFCSLVLAALVCVAVICFACSDMLRSKVWDFLSEPGGGTESADLKAVSSDVVIPEGVEVLIYPEYLPEGYELVECVDEGAYTVLIFVNSKSSNKITLQYMENYRPISLDNDRSSGEVVLVNSEEAIMQYWDSRYILLFQLESYAVELCFFQNDQNENEAIQIAKSIKIYPTGIS